MRAFLTATLKSGGKGPKAPGGKGSRGRGLLQGCFHRDGAVVFLQPLEAVAFVQADGRAVLLDAERDRDVAVGSRALEQRIQQLGAEARAALARDDRDRELGCLLVHEAVAAVV